MKQKHIKWCAFGVLIMILALLAFATIIEKIYGREFVLDNVYGAWWMVSLWAVLGVASFVYILMRSLYRQKAVFMMHCAFILILMGAFITYLTAERGIIHLRQGEIMNTYLSETDMQKHPLPFDIKLVLFDIEYHPGTDEPADYISFLKVNDEICRVSMNKIHKEQGYRLYQMDYDRDEMGSTLLINYDPWGIAITYTGYILLAISMMWLLWLRIGWRRILYTAIPVACMWFYISQINPMTPVLRSPMLAAHVSVIMISYGLFIFITVTSIIGLCSGKRRKSLYRLNSQLLYPALFLLIAGIFIGAVWANISWGRYWGWDAKETWALITMFIYAFPMHKSSLPMFRSPKKFHLYCVLALLTVAMTFFGVTYFLGGIHSYV